MSLGELAPPFPRVIVPSSPSAKECRSCARSANCPAKDNMATRDTVQRYVPEQDRCETVV